MWFRYGLKAQKLLAQGNTMGTPAISLAPCRGKSFKNIRILRMKTREEYSALFGNYSTIYHVNRVIIHKKEGFCLEVTSFYLIFAEDRLHLGKTFKQA